MGYSLSWIVAKGQPASAFRSLMNLRPTGRMEEIPESKVTGVQLPGGGYLVVFNRKTLDGALLERISMSGELIYCEVEEHVMHSCASCWVNGKQVWSVVHSSEEGTNHLQVLGEPPKELSAIRDELVAKQRAEGQDSHVDYIFDVPVELAGKLTGFRHDQDIPGLSGDVFEVMEPAGSGANVGKWWQVFRGGKNKD